MFAPQRIETEELLDAHDAPREDVERSLLDLQRINRWLGGIAIYRSLVRRFGPASILDVGTGTSDLLASVPDAGLRVGLDFKIDHLLYPRDDRKVLRVVGDARNLPFRDGSVDLITSAHFVHHFSPDENVAMFDEALRVCRLGVAANDTQRHWIPLLFVRLLGALGLFGRITVHDAPASVRQAYTTREAGAIADRTRASRWKVTRKWPFRFAILLWK